MAENPNDIENKIVLAAIDCIEKYGMDGTTIRQIARAAEVNVAAINYYFRSKDALIRKCREVTLKNAFDFGAMPPMPNLGPTQRCIAIFQELMEGGFRYPGITRSHFRSLIVEGKEDPLLAESLSRFMKDLCADLEARGCPLGRRELGLAISQMLSAVFMTTLAPTLFGGQGESDFRNPKAGKAYLTHLVEKFLA
jgi:AcrR family transcriptional regulator